MKGRWNGFYIYDSERIQNLMGVDRTYFEIEIVENENGIFEGTVEDDIETGGTKGTGQVEGQISEGNVSFIKFMPIASLIFPDGKRKDMDKRHPKVYYSGTLQSDNRTILGNWKIKLGFMSNGLWPLIIFPTTGKFEMRKNYLEDTVK